MHFISTIQNEIIVPIKGEFLGRRASADPTVRGALRGKNHSKQRPRGAAGPATLHRCIPPVYVPVFWEQFAPKSGATCLRMHHLNM